MQPHSNKMSQSFIFACHGRHFDISSVRSALRSSCTGRPGRTIECGASKARMGWTSSGSSPADSAHQASSQGIICGTLCFDYFYFLLLLANAFSFLFMNPQATRAHPHWGKAMEMWSMFWEISVQVEEHHNLKNHKRVVIFRNRWKTHVRKCTGSEPVSSKLEEVGFVVSEN